MAQGDVTVFEEFSLNIGKETHDLPADSYKIALLSVMPSADLATPDYADVSANEVTGDNYTAGGIAATFTYTEVGGLSTFALDADVTWNQHATGPTGIVAGLIYNTTYAGANGDAIGFIDMRDGGVTAISLQDGNITIQAGTAFTLQ